MSVVALHAIVQILRSTMLNTGQNCVEGRRIALRLVRRDSLRPHTGLVERAFEESLGSLRVTALRDVRVDHVPILVNRAVDVRLRPVQTRVRFINAPLRTDGTAIRTSSLLKQWQEALDPAIDRAAINNETALREPFDNVGVTQAVANIPADRQSDHVIREAMM